MVHVSAFSPYHERGLRRAWYVLTCMAKVDMLPTAISMSPSPIHLQITLLRHGLLRTKTLIKRYSDPVSADVDLPFQSSSPHHIPNRTLHPQLRVLPMQPLAKPTNRLLLRLAQSLVEDALESKFGVAFVNVDLGRDLEQAVRGP